VLIIRLLAAGSPAGEKKAEKMDAVEGLLSAFLSFSLMCLPF
jgi:hypothetical protein